MISLSAIPLYLSIIFTFFIYSPAKSQESEIAFDKKASRNQALKIVEIVEEGQEHHSEISAPSTPILGEFCSVLEKIVSPTLKRSHLQERNENEEEATFNQTPSNSPPPLSQLLSRDQKFQAVSLIASLDIKKFAKLKKDYEPPFTLSVNSSTWAPVQYDYEFQESDLNFGKVITLAENFPIIWKKLPLYFSYTFMGHPKTKNRDTNFDFEEGDRTLYKQQIIVKGKIGRGLTKRVLLKYSLPKENTNNLPISILLNIFLFDKEQTTISLTMGQKVKELI